MPSFATVLWTTAQAHRRLRPDGDQEHAWVDPSGRVCLLEAGIPAVWAGKKLAGLNEAGSYWLTSVTRLGEAQVVSTDLVGQEGDRLRFVSNISALDALRHRLEHGPDH